MAAPKLTNRKPWFEDLTGMKFWRLTVIACEGFRSEASFNRSWRCKCSCLSGIEVIVQGSSLKNGNTKSCGCLKREKMAGSEGRLRSEIPGEVRVLDRFPGYLFSSTGDTWSCWNASKLPCMTKLYYRLKPKKQDGNHLKVKVQKKWRWLHALILEAFKGPCPKGLECRHLNGDPTDNQPSNLEWGTRSENIQDRIRHGESAGWTGSIHGVVKLNDDSARAIYLRRMQGATLGEIAEEFGVSTATVWSISKGRTWTHATGHHNT
ncbi:MAG: HNH endonuclease [Labedaea sp.]